MSSIPKSDALRNLYWRSEILRVMYWLRGEGMGDLVDVAMIRSYLDIGTDECRAQFDALVEDRSVVVDGEWYAISTEGLAQGEAEYATLFSDLARPVSGQCSDECWCRLSSDEAAACSATLLMPTRKVDVRQTVAR